MCGIVEWCIKKVLVSINMTKFTDNYWVVCQLISWFQKCLDSWNYSVENAINIVYSISVFTVYYFLFVVKKFHC